MEYEDAKRILGALQAHGVEYVLVGSMAMATWGVTRATQDMDIFVLPEPDNVERLKAALRSVFEDPSIDEISAKDLAGPYPAIKYVPPAGDFSLDILARLGEAFAYRDLEWEELEVDGVVIRTATPAMLYRMKRDTVRPQDRLDAAELKRRYDLEEP
jgi:hypothetical protein